MTTAGAAPRAWHPVTGAGLVALPAAAAVMAAVAAGGPSAGAAGLTAFLAMGAVAGFAVSGST